MLRIGHARFDENGASRQLDHRVHEDHFTRKVLARQRGNLEAHQLTTTETVGVAFRDLERGLLRIHRLQRDERRLRGDIGAEAHEPAAGDAGERRAHDGAIEPRLEQIVGCVRRARLSLRLLQIRGRRRILRHELLRSLQRLLRQLAIGFRAGDLRLELGVVHLEQRGALLHELAFANQDLHDAPGNLGLQLDGLHRLDLSRGSDGVDDGIADRGGNLDRHGRHSPARARPAGRRRFRLLARGQKHDQHDH